jgi:8-amino-7-oxononanoate synthase
LSSPVDSHVGSARQTPLFDKCRAFDLPQRAQAAGVYSYFRVIESAQEPEVWIDGRRFIMLGSNNYLGLTNHPKVKEAAIAAVQRYGTGCGGSRFLNGTLDLHTRLEEKLAAFIGTAGAVVFSTGFQVNLGVISCLVDRDDIIYLDKQDHACIFDGARLSMGEVRRFRHNDTDDLLRLINTDANGSAGKLIVVDGVFSMEGDIAPLPQIVAIARNHGAAILLDDAHGIGVLGPNGRGTAEHFGLEAQIDLVMGTFSKSLASVGGFVCGDSSVIQYIRHKARSFIFSAAPAPACAAAASAALDILQAEPQRREALWKNTRFMLEEFRRLGFDTGESQTPVIPLIIGEDINALIFARRLHDAGLFVNAVVPPATPRGRALIRTSYMATHTQQQLCRALEIFEKVGRELAVI